MKHHNLLALWISYRYLASQHKNGFISFIAFFSILGLIIGVASLLTVMSVMNGFHQVISEKLFMTLPHISVMPTKGRFQDWQSLAQELKTQPGVTQVYPSLQTELFSISHNQINPVIIQAMSDEALQRHLRLIDLPADAINFANHPYGIIISKKLADELQLSEHQNINLLKPFNNNLDIRADHQYISVPILAISPMQDPLTSRIAFTTISSAQKMLNLPSTYISSLSISLADPFKATELSTELQDSLGNSSYQLVPWTEYFGRYFAALKFTRHIMFLVLSLIILVALFNAFATQVMVVKEKVGETAILISMGCTNKMVFKIFFLQGLIIAICGIVLGIIAGYLLSDNIGAISNFLQEKLGYHLVNQNIYFVSTLPAEFSWSDVFSISAFTLFLSIITTYFPARTAMKKNPAEALHYEE